MSIQSVLSNARDGLMAQSAGVHVTSQNLTNASTPGYIRRAAVLETRGTGSDKDAGGVTMRTTTRAFDRFAHRRTVQEFGRLGSANARAQALETTQSTLVPSTGHTLGDKLASMFDALTTLASSPEDPAARREVLASASQLAQSFSQAAEGLAQNRTDLLNQSQGVANEVNGQLDRIAVLNKQIADMTARGEAANDLKDTRDSLVQQVGERMGAQAVYDDRGRVTLIAAGAALVESDRAGHVSVDLANDGTMRVQVTQPGSTSSVDVTTRVNNGTLGGLREARDHDIPALQTELDNFAYDLTQRVNAVHTAGVGLDGLSGRALFAPQASAVGAARAMALDPAMDNHPERVAAADTTGTLPGGNTTALALTQLASLPLGGASSPQSRWTEFASRTGTLVQSATNERALREDTLHQAQTAMDGVSSVSIEEEMVNLSQFQRAFEASLRVVRTADEMMDTLLKMV